MKGRTIGICGLLAAGVILVVAHSASVSPKESVGAELEKLRREKGFSLVTAIGNKLYEVDYTNRSLRPGTTFFAGSDPVDWGTISSDGTQVAFTVKASKNSANGKNEGCSSNDGCLALGKIDGTGFRLFGSIRSPYGMCWSHDGSHLVLSGSNPQIANGDSTPILQVLNLETGDAEQIADLNAVVTSQCWSADDSEIAYTLNKDRGVSVLRLFDERMRKSRDIAEGAFATWSPSGRKIGFLRCPPSLEDCDYDIADPLSNDRSRLFHVDVGQTPMWWSPDGRFVAYVNPVSRLENSLPSKYVYRLRVRRLSDNTEDWVLDLSETDVLSFQWVNRAGSLHD